MWMNILLDAAGVLLMSGAVLLWIWLWRMVHNPDPWFPVPVLAGITLFVSLFFLALGLYLLKRKESRTDLNTAGNNMTPVTTGWSSKTGFKESRPPKEEYAKAAEPGTQAEEETTAKREREEAAEPAPTASTAPGRSGGKPSDRESGVASPYIILGVHESDTLEAITDVYAGLATVYAPDKNSGVNEYSKARKAEQLEKIKSAYEWIRMNHQDASARPRQREDVKALYREACDLINSKEYLTAIQTISKSVALDPNDAACFNLLGSAHMCLSNYQEAVKAFDRAIELGANRARVFNNRGFSHAQLGDAERAIEDYDRAIKSDPKCADAFNNRGIYFAERGEHRRAIENFNSAIQLDPEFAEAYIQRGLAYGELGGHQSKAEDFKTAARLGSAFAQQYLNEKGIDW